jgi:hypothetical protein
VFDCYTAKVSTSPRNVWSEVGKKKVRKGQTQRVWQWTPGVLWWTGTRSWRCWSWICVSVGAGPLARGTLVTTVLSSLGLLQAMQREGIAVVQSGHVVLSDHATTADGVLTALLAARVAAAESELAGQGRVLRRPSGTESLVRVMVEAGRPGQAQAVPDRPAVVVQQHLAL